VPGSQFQQFFHVVKREENAHNKLENWYTPEHRLWLSGRVADGNGNIRILTVIYAELADR
jgi:hypothetical protein